ncbi:MAG TPA: phosphatase PAP2 family protein [Chryseosolibacter sp.]|nr:phosphatase PAP2 family protein [Chryseosolibacter sp.]
MIQKLIELDREIFLYLNGLHHPWLDEVMYYATDKLASLPVYLLLLYLILRHFRNDSWAPLIGIVIAIVIADQLASTVMKPLFQRLRPSHEPELAGAVYTVKGYLGRKYGFVSSHAANTFAAALFFWWLLKDKSKWIWLLFLWAGIVSYSRIYLGVHYPGDILGGFVVGWLAAWVGFRIFNWLLAILDRKKHLTRKLH